MNWALLLLSWRVFQHVHENSPILTSIQNSATQHHQSRFERTVWMANNCRIYTCVFKSVEVIPSGLKCLTVVWEKSSELVIWLFFLQLCLAYSYTLKNMLCTHRNCWRLINDLSPYDHLWNGMSYSNASTFFVTHVGITNQRIRIKSLIWFV